MTQNQLCMRDRINELTPGTFNVENTAQLGAVLLGGYFAFSGRLELGLMIIAVAVGGQSGRDLLNNDP